MPGHPPPSTQGVVVAAALFVGLVLGIGGMLAWHRLAGGAESGAPPADAMMAGGVPPATVRVGTATQAEVQDRFDVVGRLVELRRATVAAEAEGKILEVPIEDGQRVKAGETVLARIDPVWSTVAVEAAEARVASAQAQAQRSDRELQYLSELQQTGAARPKEVDDAKAQAAADRAMLDAAIAERNEATHRFNRVEVVAPFDGYVVRKLAEVGQWVEPGGDIAEVVSAGQIDALVDVPERTINAVRVGDEVEVTIDPIAARVKGEVVAIVPAAATSARTFPVKVRMSDENGRLKSGMSVVAHLPVGEATLQLTVPRDAVIFRGGTATVWTAMSASPQAATDAPAEGGAEGAPPALPSAAPVAVQVLFGVDDRYVVTGAIEPGTPVVIEGGEGLFPTQPLVILSDAPPADSAAPLTRAGTDLF